MSSAKVNNFNNWGSVETLVAVPREIIPLACVPGPTFLICLGFTPLLPKKANAQGSAGSLVRDCLFPLGYSQLTSISAGRQAIRRPANAPHSGYQPPANDFRGSSLMAWESTHVTNARLRPLVMHRYRLALGRKGSRQE